MKLYAAYRLADRIKAELSTFCDAIEICGSIRRARPEPRDVDLVCLPKAGQEGALRERIKARTTVSIEGPQTLIVKLANSFQLDIWFARRREADLLSESPGNFGTLLVCRTGSKEHNIFLCRRAQHMGLKWEPHRGVLDQAGKVIASETEHEVFDALGLAWLPPVARESRS